MATLTVGPEPDTDLRVVIPFQAGFDATFDVTDSDEPDWSSVTFRIEIDGETAWTSTLVTSTATSAQFAITRTAAQTDVEWWSKRARLEMDHPTYDDPVLIAVGVAEVVR